MAELRNGFGRAFGSNNKLRNTRLFIDMGDGQKIGAQAVFPLQCPAVVRRAIRRQTFGAEGMKRFLHGIERLARASENAELKKCREFAFERTFVPLAPIIVAGA